MVADFPKWGIEGEAMSTSFREISLGPEAIDYVRDRLESGNTLSTLLLKVHDLKVGRIVTKLPLVVDDEKAKDFETGGKLPPIVGEFTSLEPVPNTDSVLLEEIRRFLTEADNNVCIFENASAKPGDPFLQSLQTRFSIFDNEIYHLLCPSDIDDDRILKTIGSARSWLFIGAMTSASDARGGLCSEKKELSESDLNLLAERTKKIIVGAYDGEGFLVWSRA